MSFVVETVAKRKLNYFFFGNAFLFYSIIQAVLGSLPISEFSLLTEAEKIMRISERITNCKLLCKKLSIHFFI